MVGHWAFPCAGAAEQVKHKLGGDTVARSAVPPQTAPSGLSEIMGVVSCYSNGPPAAELALRCPFGLLNRLAHAH